CFVYVVSLPSSARNTTASEPSDFGVSRASYPKLQPTPISEAVLSSDEYDRSAWMLIAYELDSAASTFCRVNAPVAVLTPTPRIAGWASRWPPLPAPSVLLTWLSGICGGAGSTRGV